MRVSPAAYERSIVRSNLRTRTLIVLASLGEAFPRQLAKAAGLDAGRLKAVLFGDPPDYSPGFALIPLGLVEERVTALGKVYAITPSGLRKARQLTSRWARREEVRRQRREAREGPRVYPHPRKVGDPGVPTPAGPAPTWSFTWRL